MVDIDSQEQIPNYWKAQLENMVRHAYRKQNTCVLLDLWFQKKSLIFFQQRKLILRLKDWKELSSGLRYRNILL